MNIIEQTLLNNLRDINSIFVFPTQTALQLWTDRILEISDIKGVAMDRFMAWDRFKGNSIKSQQQDKTSVPSTMRTVFARQLMLQNKAEKFLKFIVPAEYSSNSVIFAGYIASLIPSLAIWKKYFDNSKTKADDEDNDLLLIYEKYKEFLDSYNLFDPAWETPPFKKDGHHYFIFFPEILSDYIEYKSILQSTDDITMIHVPEEFDEQPEVLFFNNSRTEIKNVVSKLWEIKNNGGSWNEIAISVPDIAAYGPYLDRDLTINQIPHVMRNSSPLSSSGPGNLFQQIQECTDSDFSYDALKALLLNTNYPWKDKDSIMQLLEFGKKNHCICSFKYNSRQIDVWENSFKENPGEERASVFFHKLKNQFTKITGARTFSELRNRYFEFRSNFFDMSLCSEYADLILSRCISELTELIDLELAYSFELDSPLSFFIEYLGTVEYLPQTEKTGVQILPYKLGASAPFGYQIIVDSSQRSLSIVYQQLKFLKDSKRKRILETQESNVSKLFIQLYQMNSTKGKVYFTAAQKTFDNYSQPSSYLKVQNLTGEKNEEILYKNNLYTQEKASLLNNEAFPTKITKTQSCGFMAWKNQQIINDEDNSPVPEKITGIINRRRPSISATQLKDFFKCPRFWLYKNSLQLSEEDTSAELINSYTNGNLYHKIFEIFCNKLADRQLPLHSTPEGLSEEYRELLENSITDAINYRDGNYYNSYITKELFQTTFNRLKETITKSVEYFSQVFEGCKIFKSEETYFYSDQTKNYSCNGKIDCLLKSDLKDDYYLIDFKSTKKGIPSDNLYAEIIDAEEEVSILPLNQQNLPDFQIPMYIHLLRNDEKSQIEIKNACFYNVTDAEVQPVFGENLAERLGIEEDKIPSAKDYEPTINKLIECLDYFSDKISTGDIMPDPKVQGFSKCAACYYNPICRKTFNISRKN